MRIECPPRFTTTPCRSSLVQPLVENAIKHGIAPRRRGGHVRSTPGPRSGRLTVVKADDGARVRSVGSARGRGARECASSGYAPTTAPGRTAGHERARRRNHGHRRAANRGQANRPSGLPPPDGANGAMSTRCARVADDERPARAYYRGYCWLVRMSSVVAEAADGAEAVELIEEVRPDVALLDLQMPEVDGLGVVRLLRRTGSRSSSS